jgi:hypothetical protein
VLEGRIDHSRVVTLVRRGGHLGLAKDYLVAVQKNNLPSVNEAMNEARRRSARFASVPALPCYAQVGLWRQVASCLPVWHG